MERDTLGDPNLTTVCRVARSLGLAASVRFFPAGVPVRDAAQLALLARFVARPRLHPCRSRARLPLPGDRDARAWDAMIDGASEPGFVEAESHLRDVQAFERRVALKLRDDPRARVVVLVLTRSAHHRALLAAHRESLRAMFPLDGRCRATRPARGAHPSD